MTRATGFRRRPLDWSWALGLPFAMLGAWAAWGAAAGVFGGGAWQEFAGLAGLAVVLGGLGGALLRLSYRNNRDTILRNRLAAAWPDEPWRWRPEWDAMRIPHTSRRWGQTVLELDQLPGLIGGEFTATVVLPFRDLPTGAVHATLSATRVLVTGAGSRRRTHQTSLFERGCTAAVSASATGPRARVVIPIPAEAPATNDDHPNDEIIWRLAVTSDVHGRAFAAAFVVPVFR